MTALVRSPAISRDEAKRLVADTKWFHTFEIIDGLVTQGIHRIDPKAYADRIGIGSDLAGLKILDIGTYDGPMAFELALRGAQVVAMDIKAPDKTGFNTLAKLTGINIRHVQKDVCEIGEYFPEEFDMVLFLGVFYHVKDPIRAFENVARVIKPGGTLHVEGESFARYFENIAGAKVDPDNLDQILTALDALDDAGVPVSMAYPGTYVGGYNWFLPNRSALRGWIGVSGLEAQELRAIDTPSGSRRLIARASKRRNANVKR